MKDIINDLKKLDSINVTTFQKIYNNFQYQIGITIFFSGKEEYYLYLTPQSFEKLVIRNAVDSFCPTASITFVDKQGVYTSHFHHVGEYVRIKVIPPENKANSGEKNKKFDLYFSIEQHIIQKYENNEITYRLQCKHWTARNLSMHVNYATFINQQESNRITPYQLIYNLLNKINYPIKQQYIPDSEHKIYYITDQNETVKDAIMYALYYGCSKNDPPTYLFHHLVDDEPILYNQKFIKKNDRYEVNLNLVIPSDVGSMSSNVKQLTVKNPNVFSANKSLWHYQQRALEVKWQYNHLTRQWTQEVVTPEKIDKLTTITDEQLKYVKTSFYQENYKESNIRHYKYNWETNIYQKLKDLDLGTNNIHFTVCGNILRDAGQLINISVDKENYKNVFSGIWQTYSVLHIFQEDKYTNDIIGYRTFNLNLKESELTK